MPNISKIWCQPIWLTISLFDYVPESDHKTDSSEKKSVLWADMSDYGWGYTHDRCADKNPYPHDRRADKDSYPHDRNVTDDLRSLIKLCSAFIIVNFST